jgi:hypothetical protein
VSSPHPARNRRTNFQAFYLHRAYVMSGRKKWILFLVIPQLYVYHTSTRRHHKVPRLIFSLVIFTSSLVLLVKFTIPYRLDVRLIIASVVSPAPLISTDRGS